MGVLTFIGCGQSSNSVCRISGEMLGTTVNVVAMADSRYYGEIVERINEIDAQMKSELSIFDENSLLSRINRGENLAASEWLVRNIELADSVSRLSGGIYDVTVAPLVKAYGFGSEDIAKDVNIDSLLQFVGYEKIDVVDGRIVKSDPRVQIDLNSIAKGFTVDVVAEMLESYGVENYMVEIGGELRVKGVNPKGNAWSVGIETPLLGSLEVGSSVQRKLIIPDSSLYKAVATSGNYRRFITTEAGERIVHTINPFTGEAKESSLLSATVIAPTCALADAYATMLLASGGDRAIELAESVEDCEVYLIFGDFSGDDYRIYVSPEMEEMLVK